MFTYRQTESLNAFASNTQHQNQVTEDPEQHQVGSERLVRVVHALFITFFRLHIRRQRSLDGRLELAVNVGLRLVDFLDEVGLGIVLLCLSFGQSLTLVGSLGSPRDIMPVAESVHHQNVYRARHSTEVGPGRSEHMPGIHVQEARHEVDAVGRHQRDQDDTGSRRTEKGTQERAHALAHIEI